MPNPTAKGWRCPQRARTLLILACLLGCSFGCSMAARANMELSNIILHFEPGGSSRQDVEISNTGEAPLYVEIEPKVVLSPGEESEARAEISDPREAGLLVTPNKLVVPPGATKAVRFVNLGATTQERVYRVAATPVANAVTAEQSGLKILIGYEILAIVYPDSTSPQIEVVRDGRSFTARNTGNTNVLFREGFQCEQPNQDPEDCTPLPGKRLYPGNEWVLELPHDLPVTYYQSVGTRNFVESYP